MLSVRTIHLICCVAAMAATAPAGVQAQSLKEQRAREAQEEALRREAAFTESVCGSDLAVSIDWRSAANWPANASLSQACDGALSALEAICRSGGKARAKRINAFTCAGDGGGASLNGSRLRYGAKPGANGFSETKALLDARL